MKYKILNSIKDGNNTARLIFKDTPDGYPYKINVLHRELNYLYRHGFVNRKKASGVYEYSLSDRGLRHADNPYVDAEKRKKRLAELKDKSIKEFVDKKLMDESEKEILLKSRSHILLEAIFERKFESNRRKRLVNRYLKYLLDVRFFIEWNNEFPVKIRKGLLNYEIRILPLDNELINFTLDGKSISEARFHITGIDENTIKITGIGMSEPCYLDFEPKKS